MRACSICSSKERMQLRAHRHASMVYARVYVRWWITPDDAVMTDKPVQTAKG
ncbi:hypothetical protein AB5N19_09078 [Seiridium cardinale]|uniref:Uncharacterized protein n=1 Tax=Seiridium cardinale TaxID=138064 RepID=A0ABR2Y7J0_9PEZI